MGWIQDLWNRLRRKKQKFLYESNEASYNIVNNMNQYIVDTSEIDKRREEELDFEEIINAAERGFSIDIIINQYKHLSQDKISACFVIGNSEIDVEDLKPLGGVCVIVEKMIEYATKQAQENGMTENEAIKFMPNAQSVINQMLDSREKQYKEIIDKEKIHD